LTKEAAEVLKEYYMDLRYPSDGRRRLDTVPITTRQLEALIRLSQARAKACLREFVLKEDALDVVELLKKSVEQVHTDEFGLIDRGRAGAGGQSNRRIRNEFIKEWEKFAPVGEEVLYDDLLRIADRVNCPISYFNTIIDDMRSQGRLMVKANKKYVLLHG
jgi:DNA helicase MCM8